MHGDGLSVQTLVIASLASAAAAILTSLFWESGTVFSAAFTPVIVSLVSAALKKPASTISQVRVRRQRAAPAGGPQPAGAPMESLAGSSTAESGGASGGRRFLGRRINVRVALVTGGLAFLIAAAVLTLPELLTGRSVAGETGRTTLGGGSSDEPETREAGDSPAERDAAVPAPGSSSSAPEAPAAQPGTPAQPSEEPSSGSTAPKARSVPTQPSDSPPGESGSPESAPAEPSP